MTGSRVAGSGPRADRFARLGAGRSRLTISSAAWLLVAIALRRCMSADKLFTLAMPERRACSDSTTLSSEVRIAVAERKAALERACRALHIANCLVRATAFGLALRRAGIGSTLHIGVRKSGEGSLAAHAWVSISGTVVIGGDAVGEPTESLNPDYVEILPAALPSRKLTPAK